MEFRPVVFLSYNKHDEALIRQIAIDLRSHQIDAWYDKWEIKPGERLRQRILGEAIPSADAFFVYLTPESIKSNWVQDELDAAFVEESRNKGLQIITFVNSADIIPLLRPDIAGRNCPVISFNEYDVGLRQLIRTVCEAAFQRRYKQFELQVQYVLQPTLRQISLLDSLKSVGLVDIENRDDKTHDVPPSEFYRLAKKELFISGVSAQRSFDQEIGTLRDALAEGKLLRVLIMRPDSEVMRWLTLREKKDISLNIQDVIRTAQFEGFVNNPNFSMRLMDKFPTFTAVMLDGDIEKSLKESFPDVQVRIQPTTIYQSHHGGLVLQLRKSAEVTQPLFDFVADELREQWSHAANLADLLKGDLKHLLV